MQVNPYLSFDGTCAEAFRFYEGCFKGRIGMMMKYSDAPMAEGMAPEARDRVMHVSLEVGGTSLMGSDSPIGRHQAMQGAYVSLMMSDAAEAERVFGALAEGGVVHMPLGETFWAERFGMVADRFGIAWMVNCMKPTP